MNKKILVSVLTIGVVAIAAIGGTIAYFSDTETSANNIIVAGDIDLKVDHKYQTYNGTDCHTCGITLYSNNEDKVVEYNGNPVNPATNAVPVDQQYIHSEWDAGDDVPSPSQWIWRVPMNQEDTIHDITAKFEKTFVWQGGATGATLNLVTAADNGVKAELNGCMLFDRLNFERNFDDDQTGVPVVINVPVGCLQEGNNTLKFTVKNFAQTSGTPYSNPAALKYYFEIDGNCDSRLELGQNCNLWGEKDLTPGDKFWNFSDIKPGDYGTNLISLHVKSNDAWACAAIKEINDQENTLIQPEINDGDGSPNQGELSQLIQMVSWIDNGDGVHQSGEEITYNGAFGSASSVALFDTANGGAIPGNTTKYIGIFWCAGSTITVNGDGSFRCDGAGINNTAQTDSFTASFEIEAVQSRNNPGFTCNGLKACQVTNDCKPAGAGDNWVGVGCIKGYCRPVISGY